MALISVCQRPLLTYLAAHQLPPLLLLLMSPLAGFEKKGETRADKEVWKRSFPIFSFSRLLVTAGNLFYDTHTHTPQRGYCILWIMEYGETRDRSWLALWGLMWFPQKPPGHVWKVLLVCPGDFQLHLEGALQEFVSQGFDSPASPKRASTCGNTQSWDTAGCCRIGSLAVLPGARNVILVWKEKL